MTKINKKKFTKTSFVLIFAIFLCSSCRIDGNKLSNCELENHEQLILKEGAADSYLKVYDYYDYENQNEKSLPYSLVMALKYNNAIAYYGIYESLIVIETKGVYDYTLIKYLNKPTADFAMDCLKKSDSLGYFDGTIILIKHLKSGIGIKQDSLKAVALEKKLKLRQ